MTNYSQLRLSSQHRKGDFAKLCELRGQNPGASHADAPSTSGQGPSVHSDIPDFVASEVVSSHPGRN